MTDRSMDFTGNNDWAQMGKAIDPADHPATNIPDATDHHDGTVLGTDGASTMDAVNGRRIPRVMNAYKAHTLNQTPD